MICDAISDMDKIISTLKIVCEGVCVDYTRVNMKKYTRKRNKRSQRKQGNERRKGK